MSRLWALAPGGAAVVLGVGAGIALGVAGSAAQELKTTMGVPATYDVKAVQDRGQAAATLGYVALGLAGASAAAAVVLAIVGVSPTAPQAGVVVTRDGAAVTIQGVFP